MQCGDYMATILWGSMASPYLRFGDAGGGGRVRKDLEERDDMLSATGRVAFPGKMGERKEQGCRAEGPAA